jgi:hypothetical protein
MMMTMILEVLVVDVRSMRKEIERSNNNNNNNNTNKKRKFDPDLNPDYQITIGLRMYFCKHETKNKQLLKLLTTGPRSSPTMTDG